ncbi:MAG: hypothetical protein FWF49_01595 [Oscillospiraceae bacterium]|nr:hypothetical protein [Oscillospiraceae bacterium]
MSEKGTVSVQCWVCCFGVQDDRRKQCARIKQGKKTGDDDAPFFVMGKVPKE